MPVADWPWQTRPLPLSLTLSGHCITRPRRRLVSFRAAPSWMPLRYGRSCSWGPSGTPCPAHGAPQVTLSCPRAPQIRPFLPTGTHGPLWFTRIFFNVHWGPWVSTCISVSKEKIGRRSKWCERVQPGTKTGSAVRPSVTNLASYSASAWDPGS